MFDPQKIPQIHKNISNPAPQQNIALGCGKIYFTE